jgi:DinB family protein
VNAERNAERSGERDWYRVVAEERCDECGMRAGDIPRADLGPALLDVGRQWSRFLRETPAATLRERTHPGVWTPLEYAAHTRDALGVFADRMALALAEDEPEFGWWDHDAAAVEERYNEQDPIAVGDALDANAQRLVAVMQTVPDDGWERAGTRRGYERFTVEGIARYSLHEATHHLHDARA